MSGAVLPSAAPAFKMASETATREITTVTVSASIEPRQAAALGDSDRTGKLFGLPMRQSKRDRLYDLLREAGGEGLKLSEIPPDLPCPAVHMDSLRFEGHRIEDYTGQDPETHRFERRWVLREDAWTTTQGDRA